ncbi:MAG TPA: hypothetical protein VLW50_18470, partial [Streptosporangiaceae bacterium]|nr:hypothetical protein [Streptosporangiaceae bacterium]
PRLLAQSEYNQRLKSAAPLMEAALRWLAEATPASADRLRLMDATPIACGQSVITARRSGLYGWAGYGYCPSHSRWYWGAKLLLICTCEGTVTGFALANPKLAGEREQARTMLEHQPANRPPPGTVIVTDKGLSGEDTEAFFTSPDLGLTLIRPARKRRAGSPVSPELAAPAGRGHHLDPEKPARPRTPRRPRPGRAVGPHRPAAARAQRRHLVQLADQRPHQALPHQLRPLSCPHFPVNDLGCPSRGVLVIPILAEGAVMPDREDLPESLASLARRNALPIRHDSFRYDAGRLVTAIEQVLSAPPGADTAHHLRPRPSPKFPPPLTRRPGRMQLTPRRLLNSPAMDSRPGLSVRLPSASDSTYPLRRG